MALRRARRIGPAAVWRRSDPLDDGAGLDLGPLAQDQGVTWSEELVVIGGEVIDGVFVAAPMSD